MNLLLIFTVLLVALLAVLAVIVALREADHAQGVGTKIEEAVGKSNELLAQAQADDLGAPVITARMSGLVEYVHGLTAVRDTERRTNTVMLLTVLAGFAVAVAGTYAVVDRIEERRERTACVEALPSLAGTTTTIPPTADEPAGSGPGDGGDEVEGGGEAESSATTAPTGDEPAGNAPAGQDTGPEGATTTTPSSTAITLPLSLEEAKDFLDACID